MNTSSWVAYKTLLKWGDGQTESTLAHYLSSGEQGKLQSVNPSKENPFTNPLSTKERIEQVHYSWLIPFLEPFTESDKEMILSSLNVIQARKLKKHFKMTESSIPLKGKAQDYLVSAVYDWLITGQKEFLPLEFLPENPLNALLDLQKKELQKLVDYLGLHDLCIELKHVIKSEQIKKIQMVLSKEEQDYLKSLLKMKESLSFARLNLDGWNGDGEKLKAILHHRGFNRLAKGLFGSHPSLLWHICHRLDTGRTKILRKFFTDIKNEEAKKTLINQILGLIPTIQRGS